MIWAAETYKSKLSLDNPLSEAPDEKISSFLKCSSVAMFIGGSQKLSMLSIRSSGWVPKSLACSKSSDSIEKIFSESRKAPSGFQSSLDCKETEKTSIEHTHESSSSLSPFCTRFNLKIPLRNDSINKSFARFFQEK